MRRLILLALGLVLVAGLTIAVVGRRAPRAPEGVYTVAQVRAGLVRQPAAWAGRTVLVRGAAVLSFWRIGPAGGQSILCALPPPLHAQQFCPLAAPEGTTVYLGLE